MPTDRTPGAAADDARRFHTVVQVAERLQVSARTVRRWIERGDLVAHRFGSSLRVSEPDLAAFERLHRQA